MSACDGHKEIGFARPTWSLPPHSPAGAFAPKDMASPLLTLSALPPAGLTSKPHHARRNFSGLRGSFRLRLASIFNHGRARTHPHYTRNSIRCQSRKGGKASRQGMNCPCRLCGLTPFLPPRACTCTPQRRRSGRRADDLRRRTTSRTSSRSVPAKGRNAPSARPASAA